ncbi:MAG: cob(I)yrinic acid a,c-diamide adenosyltransferase [Thermovenabulum sp.]|uniref:cob(I)yrinic acid a,c-diamide adenosyltransferase n=1 Tax=Thermovenabulum sp. TaxID=3100335 RepID=UPI003C7AC58D
MAEKGLVLLYTGNGKGKTTAALGLALRAAGHGQKIFMIQFMKGNPKYGEIQASKYIPNFTVVQKGRDAFVKKGNPEPVDLELAKEGLDLAKDILQKGEHDLVILDEINVAVDFGLLKEEDVVDLIKFKKPNTTLVLTGRYASEKLISIADMVSEVEEIKHHYKKGIPAQAGIEF